MCLIFGKFPDFELTLDKWLWREDSWIVTPPLVGSYIWLCSQHSWPGKIFAPTYVTKVNYFWYVRTEKGGGGEGFLSDVASINLKHIVMGSKITAF